MKILGVLLLIVGVAFAVYQGYHLIKDLVARKKNKQNLNKEVKDE